LKYIFFNFAPRLDSGYASKSKNLASGACGYLQGITVETQFFAGRNGCITNIPYFLRSTNNFQVQYFLRSFLGMKKSWSKQNLQC
jgi:hypothetical protein